MVYSGEMKFLLVALLLQTATARLSCIGYGVANKKWCEDNCNMPTPNCPSGLCECVDCSTFDSQQCDGHKQCAWQGDSCGPASDSKRALDTINCASFTTKDTCYPHEKSDGCIWVYTFWYSGYCKNGKGSQSVKARSLETSDCSAHKTASSCDGDKACVWTEIWPASYCHTKMAPVRILADKCVGLNQTTCLSDSACFWDYNGKYCEAKGASNPPQERSLVASDCSAHKAPLSCDGDKACFWHYNGHWNSYCDTKMAPVRILTDKCVGLSQTTCLQDSACFWDYKNYNINDSHFSFMIQGRKCAELKPARSLDGDEFSSIAELPRRADSDSEAKGASNPPQERSLVASDCSAHKDAASCDGDKACVWAGIPYPYVYFCVTKIESTPARSLDGDEFSSIQSSETAVARNLDNSEPDCSQYNQFKFHSLVEAEKACGQAVHCKWVSNGGHGYCTWTKDAERRLDSDYSCWGEPSQDCIALYCNWDGQTCTPKKPNTKKDAVVFQI